jgi:hypothetical protein
MSEQKLTLEILRSWIAGENATPIMGGDKSNPTWDEYISRIHPKWHPHFKLIREAILDRANGLYQITGEQKQNMGISFMFSDGEHWSFSWRAWGDLMQAIMNQREGYMAYYM